MTNNPSDLKSHIESLSDEQLLQMLTSDASEYRMDALILAKDELHRRGLIGDPNVHKQRLKVGELEFGIDENLMHEQAKTERRDKAAKFEHKRYLSWCIALAFLGSSQKFLFGSNKNIIVGIALACIGGAILAVSEKYRQRRIQSDLPGYVEENFGKGIGEEGDITKAQN
jgi:hypothetical protein